MGSPIAYTRLLIEFAVVIAVMSGVVWIARTAVEFAPFVIAGVLAVGIPLLVLRWRRNIREPNWRLGYRNLARPGYMAQDPNACDYCFGWGTVGRKKCHVCGGSGRNGSA